MAVAASLGWGSLLMSFHAGNVVFLPQCPVIGSAAGTGRGLPARHRSLPGVPQDRGGQKHPCPSPNLAGDHCPGHRNAAP